MPATSRTLKESCPESSEKEECKDNSSDGQECIKPQPERVEVLQMCQGSNQSLESEDHKNMNQDEDDGLP